MRDALLTKIKTGWQNVSTQNSSHLGDRTKYLGLTDILPGTCPHERLSSKRQELICSPEQAVVFARGHAAEDLLAAAFDTVSIKYTREIELCIKDLPIPIKGHIDFSLDPAELRKLGVEVPAGIDAVFLECKSKDEVPGVPDDMHIDQAKGQIWLARENGINAIAFIYVIDMLKGGMKLFGPLTHDTRYLDLLSRAEYLTMGLIEGKQLRAIPGIACGGCAFREECPTFPPKEVPEEISEIILRHHNLGKATKDLTKERDTIRDVIAGYIGNDSRFSVNGLQVNLKTFPGTTTYDGASLATSIESLRGEMEAISSILVSLPFSDNPSDDAVEAYNSIAKLLESIPEILRENSGMKAGYKKLEIKSERVARQKVKKDKAEIEKEAA